MTAIIPINDQYQIELFTYSCLVSKSKNRKNHPEGVTFKGESWHRTPHQVGESLVQRYIAEDDAEGIQEVVDALHPTSSFIAHTTKESLLPDSWLGAHKMVGNQV